MFVVDDDNSWSVFQEAIDVVRSHEDDFNNLIEQVNSDRSFTVDLEGIKFGSERRTFQEDIEILEVAIGSAIVTADHADVRVRLIHSISELKTRFFRALSTLQIHIVHGAFCDAKSQKRLVSLFTRNQVSRS